MQDINVLRKISMQDSYIAPAVLTQKTSNVFFFTATSVDLLLSSSDSLNLRSFALRTTVSARITLPNKQSCSKLMNLSNCLPGLGRGQKQCLHQQGSGHGKENSYFQAENLSFQQLLCVYQDKHLSIVSTLTGYQYIHSTYTDLGHQIMKNTAASPISF